MNDVRRARIAAGVLVGALALAACTGGAVRSDGVRPELGDLPTPAADLPRVGRNWLTDLPFATSEEEDRLLYEAVERWMSSCMAERGFTYRPATFPANPYGLDLVSPLDRGYAERLGYHHPEVDYGNGVQSTGPAYDLAFFGPDDDPAGAPGCGVLVFEALYGPMTEFIDAADHARNQLSGEITRYQDSEVRSRNEAAWSSCMQEQGYHYDHPGEARDQFMEAPVITEAEIAVRLADLDCDLEVGLTAEQSAFEEALIRDWMRDNEALVSELLVLKRTQFDPAIRSIQEGE